jgi:hypothetical protein
MKLDVKGGEMSIADTTDFIEQEKGQATASDKKS